MLEVGGLSKLYGRRHLPAVDDVNLKVADGEIVGLAGLNGAGKTTTINAATGVILPTSGKILVDGLDIVKEKPKASRSIGWVSEYPSFEQNVKPVFLMQYFAGFYNIPPREAKERIAEVLKSVGLDRALDRKISTYSQGMKKRFGLASAMISDPRNYLLDEILNGLDPEGIHYVRNLLLQFRDEGKAVLLSTHILGVLEDLADRVIILHKGKVLEDISKESMKKLGKTALRLRVDRVDAALIRILSRYGKPVAQGLDIVISGVENEEQVAEMVSLSLIKEGYRLSHLELSGASLEEHFLRLIEANS